MALNNGCDTIKQRPYYCRLASVVEQYVVYGVLKVKVFVGKYVKGRGMSSNQSLWKGSHVEEYLGGTPCLGSFNIELNEPVQLSPNKYVISRGGSRSLWPAMVLGHRCLVDRWPECPMHIIECISRVKLSDLLDEKNQTVEVLFEHTAPIPLWKFHAWKFVWARVGAEYYSDDYWNTVQKSFLLRKAASLARQKR